MEIIAPPLVTRTRGRRQCKRAGIKQNVIVRTEAEILSRGVWTVVRASEGPYVRSLSIGTSRGYRDEDRRSGRMSCSCFTLWAVGVFRTILWVSLTCDRAARHIVLPIRPPAVIGSSMRASSYLVDKEPRPALFVPVPLH